jgi:hypothetical protein
MEGNVGFRTIDYPIGSVLVLDLWEGWIGEVDPDEETRQGLYSGAAAPKSFRSEGMPGRLLLVF